MHILILINNIMGIFDIIQGVQSTIGQFTGAMGPNQLVPPLEVEQGGMIGDAFDWIKNQGFPYNIAGTLLGNTFTPVAIRSSLSGLPFGGSRPSNNISTSFRFANNESKDWRIKLIVPPENPIRSILSDPNSPLLPLGKTGGVIFPYTPTIETHYTAEYEDMHPTHSNYATPAYNKSKADAITMTADFSSNSAEEACYSLAVIHFFRTVTKMFFANDGPNNGRPPPILWLYGMGTYMFNGVPVVCKAAHFSFPKEADYVASVPSGAEANPNKSFDDLLNRAKARVDDIAGKLGPIFGENSNPAKNSEMPGFSYVPTHFTLQVQLQPIYSRTEIAEKFSLTNFARGQLTKDGGFI